MIPVRAPAGDFPEPAVHSRTSLAGCIHNPAAVHTESNETKKNPANQIARFGAYPSSRILIAVSVQ